MRILYVVLAHAICFVLTASAQVAPQFQPIKPPQTATPPQTAPTQPTTATANPNVIQTRGILEVPKRNNVVLAASYQAVLMSLQTESRDAQGNIRQDESGAPILVPIAEGMRVFKGQTLGNLDDRELHNQLRISECELGVAVAQKENKTEVVLAARKVQTTTAALNMLKDANRRHDGTIPPMEMIMKEFEVLQAEAELELQKYSMDVLKTEEVKVRQEQVEAMKVRIELRKLVSPIDGIVVKIDKAEGEWLREGDPVLEIVQLNTLRAKCKVSARYSPDMVDGKDVSVFVPMPDGRNMEFPGKVVFADPKISAGDEFEIFIEVQNLPSGRSWQLQPGRTVSAAIRL